MDIVELADWHRKQAQKLTPLLRRKTCNGEPELRKFHLEAAKLVESFSQMHQERRLAEVEIDVRIRAIESFEGLAKALLVEAKDLKKISSPGISD